MWRGNETSFEFFYRRGRKPSQQINIVASIPASIKLSLYAVHVLAPQPGEEVGVDNVVGADDIRVFFDCM